MCAGGFVISPQGQKEAGRMAEKPFGNSGIGNLEQDVLWTVTDVANYLRIKPETVRALTRRGDLPAIKIGKVWRYDPRRIRTGDFSENSEKH